MFMTNYDYIMEHVSPREVALAMRPTAIGFGNTTIFEKAWRAWGNHCKAMEGYRNKGNCYNNGPVNPFLYSTYCVDNEDGFAIKWISGHLEVVSFETWLAKQYNEKEWE